MTTTANMSGFEMRTGNNGSVGFYNGKVALVRWQPFAKWEFYEVTQKGRYRGMETFVRYLEDAEAARLDAVVDYQESRPSEQELTQERLRAVHAYLAA